MTMNIKSNIKVHDHEEVVMFALVKVKDKVSVDMHSLCHKGLIQYQNHLILIGLTG